MDRNIYFPGFVSPYLSLLRYFIHQFLSKVAGYEQKTEKKGIENIERNSRHVISDSLLTSHRPLFSMVPIHCTADTPCPQYKANKHQTVHVSDTSQAIYS